MKKDTRNIAKKYDICIVGGAGHVGLPLGIVFADRGFFDPGAEFGIADPLEDQVMGEGQRRIFRKDRVIVKELDRAAEGVDGQGKSGVSFNYNNGPGFGF